jgi:hypothetical protein
VYVCVCVCACVCLGQKTASLNVSVAAGIVLYQWAQWAQVDIPLVCVRVQNPMYQVDALVLQPSMCVK